MEEVLVLVARVETNGRVVELEDVLFAVFPAVHTIQRADVHPQGLARQINPALHIDRLLVSWCMRVCGACVCRAACVVWCTFVLGRDWNVLVLLAEAFALPVGRKPIDREVSTKRFRYAYDSRCPSTLVPPEGAVVVADLLNPEVVVPVCVFVCLCKCDTFRSGSSYEGWCEVGTYKRLGGDVAILERHHCARTPPRESSS